MAEIAEENAAGAAIEARDVDDADIRDTDIEFSCPHCSNSMVIDYRGAGLQVACSQCGETVLVPIPEGMELNDLDLDPGEILKQLFATRRNLQRAEARTEALEAKLAAVVQKVADLQDMLRAEA